jgi:uridine kinase
VRPIVDVVRELTDRGRPRTGPFLLAIDGRSSSGKSTLAHLIARSIQGSAVVRTDDIAWWHSRFGWDDLLVAQVIEPLRRGEAVDYRPPAWEARGRPGSIKVPSDAGLVLIEGVGAGRAALAERVDAVIWVDSDPVVTERRNRRRIAAGELDAEGYAGWMSEEVPFQAAERTWDRADVIVPGETAVTSRGRRQRPRAAGVDPCPRQRR